MTPHAPGSGQPERLLQLAAVKRADGDEAAVDIQRRHLSLAIVGLHDDFRRPGSLLDINLFVPDALLRHEHFGHTAITAQAGGIHLDLGNGCQTSVT